MGPVRGGDDGEARSLCASSFPSRASCSPPCPDNRLELRAGRSPSRLPAVVGTALPRQPLPSPTRARPHRLSLRQSIRPAPAAPAVRLRPDLPRRRRARTVPLALAPRRPHGLAHEPLDDLALARPHVAFALARPAGITRTSPHDELEPAHAARRELRPVVARDQPAGRSSDGAPAQPAELARGRRACRPCSPARRAGRAWPCCAGSSTPERGGRQGRRDGRARRR